METIFTKSMTKIGVKQSLTVLLVLLSIISLWITGINPKGIIWAAYWPAIFVLQLIIITTPWRTIPMKLPWQFFLIGMSLVPAAAFLLQYLLYALVNNTPIHIFLTSDAMLGSVDLMAPVVAPITEEILKILPVVVFLSWGRNLSWRRITGPLDTMLLGAASGAGFEFIENIFRVANNDWSSLGPDRILSPASLHFGSLYLFPDMVHSQLYGVIMIWFGHAEMSASIGLALGMGLFFKRKFKLWWLGPLLVLLWAMWDHFLVNYLGPMPTQLWARTLPALDLYGYLLPYIFLIGCIFAGYLTTQTQQWYVGKDLEAVLESGIFKQPHKIIYLIKFLRLRLMAAFALRDFNQSNPEEALSRAAWIWALRQQVVSQKTKCGL